MRTHTHKYICAHTDDKDKWSDVNCEQMIATQEGRRKADGYMEVMGEGAAEVHGALRLTDPTKGDSSQL